MRGACDCVVDLGKAHKPFAGAEQMECSRRCAMFMAKTGLASEAIKHQVSGKITKFGPLAALSEINVAKLSNIDPVNITV